MAEQEYKENIGSLKISEEVVASIAKFAAMDVDGVSTVDEKGSSLKGFLKTKLVRPIVIELNDDTAYISINISVKYGTHIFEIASKVQESVKDAVQTMTGITVAKVNVNVTGISFTESDGE